MAAKKQKLGYWEKRLLQDKANAINRTERYLQREQKRLYGAAEKEIIAEIEKLYGKFADQQKITLAEARRLIREADFKKIDWDGMIQESLDLREKLQEKDLPKEVIETLEKQHKELEARMAAYTKRGQISYLELRQIEIDRKLLSLYDANQQDIYEHLKSEYEDDYYRSVYNTQRRMGFGYDFTRPSGAAIDKAILNKWNKQNYSGTLYAHCEHFAKDLKENLITGLIRGEPLEKMSDRIRDRMGVAYSAAKRLVRTEVAYIYEQASMDAYQECGVEWYEYLATLDNSTSRQCRELDGQHFRTKDAQPGKNYPPMHPNCRSTTVVWFPGEEAKKEASTRLAKEYGKYYEVPASMTYKEWQEKYGSYAADTKEALRRRKKWDEKHDRKKALRMDELPHAEEMRNTVERSRLPAAQLLLQNWDRIRIVNTKARGNAVFLVERNAIRYNAKRDYKNARGKYTTLFHEAGHMLDHLLGRPSSSKRFEIALQFDSDTLLRSLIASGICDNIDDVYEYVNDMTRDPAYHVVRDIMRAITGNRIGSEALSHDEEYWKKPGRMGSEAFAHFVSASIVDNPKKLQSIKECFPNAWKEFEEMVKDEL